jgi:hypothetical protein
VEALEGSERDGRVFDDWQAVKEALESLADLAHAGQRRCAAALTR